MTSILNLPINIPEEYAKKPTAGSKKQQNGGKKKKIIQKKIINLSPFTNDPLAKKVVDIDRNQLFMRYRGLKKKWFRFQKTKGTPDIQKMADAFGINANHLNVKEITDQFWAHVTEISTLQQAFLENNIMSTNAEYKRNFQKFKQLIHYIKECLINMSNISIAMDPTNKTKLQDDSIQHYNDNLSAKENLKPKQSLILYVLNQLSRQRMRMHQDYCYRPVYNKDGQYTYAWESACLIQDFIHKHCNKDINFEQWQNLTSGNNFAKEVSEFLQDHNDPQFPALKKNRNVFSFSNGVYITCRKLKQDGKKFYRDEFYRFGSKHSINLPENEVACNFFKYTFDNYDDIDDWYDIPTPALQSILDFQFNKDPDYKNICRWMYILLGRMLYNVGDLDDWQVIPFLFGRAGNGKSTITKLIEMFYDKLDVGNLSNDCEETFGLSSFYDKLVFIASEIKQDFKLKQATFQQIVSAESVSIPIKFKTAKKVQWTAPGWLSGNQLFNFSDNSQSMSRRIAVFKFSQRVSKPDGNLIKKLRKEIPAILKKCNKGYIEIVNKHQGENFWNIVPKYFWNIRKEICEQLNVMESFLSSGHVEYGKDFYCRVKTFQAAFSEYCRERGFRPQKFTSDLYETPFSDRSADLGFVVKFQGRGKRKYPRNSSGRMINANFIIGLDIVEERVSSSDNDSSEETDVNCKIESESDSDDIDSDAEQFAKNIVTTSN